MVFTEREVSPKLVLGQKKYGRRSRPESSELEFETERTDQEFDDIDSDATEVRASSILSNDL